MGRPATDKRERLVRAARWAFHRHGVAGVSLAKIARQAGVPAGNSFYYFRSKDELAHAVVDEWCTHVAAVLEELEQQHADPWLRIHSLLDRAIANRAEYAASGCPLAGLSRDFRVQGGALGSVAARTYELQLEWLGRQFEHANVTPPEARRAARFVLAGLQGSFVLGYATASDYGIVDCIEQLKSWLGAMRNDHEFRR